MSLLGKPAEVYWYVGADHRGGYAYRICKVWNISLLTTRICNSFWIYTAFLNNQHL